MRIPHLQQPDAPTGGKLNWTVAVGAQLVPDLCRLLFGLACTIKFQCVDQHTGPQKPWLVFTPVHKTSIISHNNCYDDSAFPPVFSVVKPSSHSLFCDPAHD